MSTYDNIKPTNTVNKKATLFYATVDDMHLEVCVTDMGSREYPQWNVRMSVRNLSGFLGFTVLHNVYKKHNAATPELAYEYVMAHYAANLINSAKSLMGAADTMRWATGR
jgi:hypothetical protein